MCTCHGYKCIVLEMFIKIVPFWNRATLKPPIYPETVPCLNVNEWNIAVKCYLWFLFVLIDCTTICFFIIWVVSIRGSERHNPNTKTWSDWVHPCQDTVIWKSGDVVTFNIKCIFVVFYHLVQWCIQAIGQQTLNFEWKNKILKKGESLLLRTCPGHI